MPTAPDLIANLKLSITVNGYLTLCEITDQIQVAEYAAMILAQQRKEAQENRKDPWDKVWADGPQIEL